MSSNESLTRWASSLAPGAKKGRLRLTAGCVSRDNEQPDPEAGQILWNNQKQMNYREPFRLA
jgi:hypothetical protein